MCSQEERNTIACLGYAFQWSNGIQQNVCPAIVLLSEGDHLEYYIAKWRYDKEFQCGLNIGHTVRNSSSFKITGPL
jgi:hypothetical protein